MTIHHAALARMLPAEKKEKLLRQLAQSGVSPSRIPIIKADPAQAIPLSFNQERLWFLQKYDSTATNYNLYVVYRLHGVVDMPMLTEALRHVQARHAILRTRIIVRNDRPCQVIDDASSLVLDTVTLAAQAPTSALDAVIQQVINTGSIWHAVLCGGNSDYSTRSRLSFGVLRAPYHHRRYLVTAIVR